MVKGETLLCTTKYMVKEKSLDLSSFFVVVRKTIEFKSIQNQTKVLESHSLLYYVRSTLKPLDTCTKECRNRNILRFTVAHLNFTTYSAH